MQFLNYILIIGCLNSLSIHAMDALKPQDIAHIKEYMHLTNELKRLHITNIENEIVIKFLDAFAYDMDFFYQHKPFEYKDTVSRIKYLVENNRTKDNQKAIDFLFPPQTASYNLHCTPDNILLHVAGTANTYIKNSNTQLAGIIVDTIIHTDHDRYVKTVAYSWWLQRGQRTYPYLEDSLYAELSRNNLVCFDPTSYTATKDQIDDPFGDTL